MLKTFSNDYKFEDKNYGKLYKKIKGNFFRNKDHLKSYIFQNNLTIKKGGNKK